MARFWHFLTLWPMNLFSNSPDPQKFMSPKHSPSLNHYISGSRHPSSTWRIFFLQKKPTKNHRTFLNIPIFNRKYIDSIRVQPFQPAMLVYRNVTWISYQPTSIWHLQAHGIDESQVCCWLFHLVFLGEFRISQRDKETSLLQELL